MKSIDYTQKAIAAWGDNKLLEAQNLLRESVIKCDDYISDQNLAVFYMLHGQVRGTGAIWRASKYALRLLLRSRNKKHTATNSMWLGKYYFQEHRFAEAAALFYESFLQANTYVAAYCWGAALYLSDRPQDALKAYQWAEEKCTDSFSLQIAIASTFALLMVDKKTAALQMQEHDQFKEGDPLDYFLMMFFAEDYIHATEQARILLCEYILDAPVIAMVYDCLLLCMGEKQAADILMSYSECFVNFQDGKERLRCEAAVDQCDLSSDFCKILCVSLPILWIFTMKCTV